MNDKKESLAAQQFAALRSESARLGADPLQIQGAGGNTSIKQGDIMWIKASGKWLENAADEDLFVPVRRSPLLAALEASDPRAEKSVDFVVDELNPHALRPSIETTLHAVMMQRVVIHIHCVDTIALAIRQDAQTILGEHLGAFHWAFVPYTRPGLPLSRSISTVMNDDTDVLVLGNHGLVVAADSVADAVALLERVRFAVKCQPRKIQDLPDKTDGLAARVNPTICKALMHRIKQAAFLPALQPDAHAIAFDRSGLAVAAGGSLYPDHVIFLGKGTVVAMPGEDVDAVVQRCQLQNAETPTSIVFPGEGVVLPSDATAGQQAMARCLSDVCLRVPDGAAIHYLNDEQNHELLHWEAEQYRQALNQPGS
ncbi:MAG: class II aldolase/adducin family protein [Granulosicoccus sp.]